MTRDAFREAVFARDGNKCVICGNTGKLDAHHIIERRLWSDGGYYADNGASLCAVHHIEAEKTTLSCDEIRLAAKITKIALPDHFYNDNVYDKWGNVILETGRRLKGELFDDESVQKILKEGGALSLFEPYVKYPRTYHLPWSPGLCEKDKIIPSLDGFKDRQVVITAKMDGENTTMYRDHIHARSMDSRHHVSRSWVKQLHGQICMDIPEGWRICGENLWAKHSIHYQNLRSYFYMFSIWNERNVCLSWDETIEWSKLLGLELPPELYRGNMITAGFPYDDVEGDQSEGYVVRVADSFPFSQFKTSVAKYVRENHVQTNEHWLNSKTVLNNLKEQA